MLWDKGDHAQRKLADLSRTITLCERLYKVKGTIVTRKILSEDRDGEKEKRSHYVFTVRTSDEARAKIYLDLRLFHFFYRRKKATRDRVCTLMNCSWQEMKGSLHRLSKWCSLFKGKYSKTIPLRSSS